MILKVISPEKQYLCCEVTAVELPGTKGRFMVLSGHAPLISSLTEGFVRYDRVGGTEREELGIKGGFVEVLDDNITLCVD